MPVTVFSDLVTQSSTYLDRKAGRPNRVYADVRVHAGSCSSSLASPVPAALISHVNHHYPLTLMVLFNLFFNFFLFY